MPKGRHRPQRHKPPTPRRQPPRKAKNRSTSSSNAAKIEEYMRSHGVIRRAIMGDGNCLFRAMADQLGYGEERHREIRERVVKTILQDKEYFANFIDGDEVETVEDYCEEMAKDGVWGDDIELEAFRRAYKKPIVIYDASTGTPYVKPYDGDEGMSLNTVHLWKSECHYESVRNKDGPFEGPSKVIYKDVQLSKADVERINREYEDSIVKELKSALPHIGLKEIRTMYQQLGTPDKVLEFFTGFAEPSYVENPSDAPTPKPEEEATEGPTDPPTDVVIPDGSPTFDPAHATLSESMEFLSLNPPTNPSAPIEPDEETTAEEEEIVGQPSPSPSAQLPSPKAKGRQRRRESAARRERRIKQERKEAAKRRKQQEKLGIIPDGKSDTIREEHSTLKAIIV